MEHASAVAERGNPRGPAVMGAGDLADLLACVTAFARSLEGKFDPQRFLDEFSERSQPLVPHDGTVIAWLEDEGRSFSAFAGGRVIGAFLMH